MLKRLLPETITDQAVALFAALLAGILLITAGTFTIEHGPGTEASVLNARIERLAGLAAETGRQTGPAVPVLLGDRAADGEAVFLADYSLAERVSAPRPLLVWAWRLERELADAGVRTRQIAVVHGRVPPQARPAALARPAGEEGDDDLVLSVQIRPGVWINSLSRYRGNLLAESVVWYLLPPVFILCVVAVWLFARNAVRSVGEIERCAECFGRGEQVPAVSETGPVEVRDAARAFNRMQQRLSRSISTQRTIIRAVSHDLRTPLTELRIRAEDIPDEFCRDKIIATIEEMGDIVKETLQWAQEASGSEALEPVDIAALVESLADDFMDIGHPVASRVTAPVIVRCRRVALRRAVRNLIDNALAHAESVTVRVEADAENAVIHVEDNGPGIPEDQICDVLNPFVRLDRSRNRPDGGVGLGLSIVQTIAEMHGGTIRLSNRVEGGLSACMLLPCTANAEES